jgi:hypothetical protein
MVAFISHSFARLDRIAEGKPPAAPQCGFAALTALAATGFP